MRPWTIALVALLAGAASSQSWEPVASLPTGGTPKALAVGANLAGRIHALGGTPWTGGSNAATGRQEALMWRSSPSCGVADLVPPFGVLDFFDVAEFLAAFSAGCP